jgi:glutamate decarboxylase
MVPAYSLPPNAEHVTILRALCKETFPQALVETLASDIDDAIATLDKKGGTHKEDRKRVKTGTGY